MTIVRRPLTYDDLRQTPDDRIRYEIIGGEFVVSRTPLVRHQEIVGRLALSLGNHAVADRLGKAFLGPLDVKLSEHDIVAPDLIFVATERRSRIMPLFIDGAPTLIVEVIGQDTRVRDEGCKANLYAAARVPEYWIADPLARTFTLLVLKDGRYEPVPMDNGKLRSVVLPGLVIDVAALFADLVP